MSVAIAIALAPRVIAWCRWVVVKERAEGCGSGREGVLPATSGKELEAGGLRECSGRGWRGAGRLGAERAAAVSEDGLHREGILHGGDDLQPAATAGTGERAYPTLPPSGGGRPLVAPVPVT